MLDEVSPRRRHEHAIALTDILLAGDERRTIPTRRSDPKRRSPRCRLGSHPLALCCRLMRLHDSEGTIDGHLYQGFG